MAEKQRTKELTKAKKIQEYNIGYDLLEVVVSLFAGFSSACSALIGWRVDSIVEVVSASTLWWRFKGELQDISEERVKQRERITLYVIAASFLIISIFITYDAVTKFLTQGSQAGAPSGSSSFLLPWW